MSITKDFEAKKERWIEHISPTEYYMPIPVEKLLTHARALEEKLEWALDTIDDCHGSYFDGCPTCEKAKKARELLDA